MAMPLRPPLASPSCAQSNLASSAVASTTGITAKPRRRRREPSIPRNIRRDVTRFARTLGKKYRPLLAADPKLKDRLLRLIRVLLPPRPRRRGRPRNEETTRARVLYSRFRRQHPTEKAWQLWGRVCVALYPEYAGMAEIEQRDIRDALRLRIKSRARTQRARKSR